MSEATGRTLLRFAPGRDRKALLVSLQSSTGVDASTFSDVRDGVAHDASGHLAVDLGAGVIAMPPSSLGALPAGVTARAETYLTYSKPFRPRAAPRPPDGAFAIESFTWGITTVAAHTSNLTGLGVRVAVLDSGLWLDHPDFKNRDPAPVTECFVKGATVDDTSGHGTFCAGILAGPSKPHEGPRYGVAPGVTLYIGRVIDDREQAREFDVIQGISWAIQNQCRIISLSLGALPGTPQVDDYNDIAREARSKGSLLVAAAGNDSVRPLKLAPVRSPANSLLVLGVAAANRNGSAINDSNAGIHADTGGGIDMSGPGDEIQSACAPASMPYGIDGGTSVATPFVAGVAALMLEADPGLDPEGLWARLVATAVAPAKRSTGSNLTDVGAGFPAAPQSKQ